MVADPKALQYILHSGYNFPKRKDMVIVTEMVAGKNALVCAHGKPLPIMGFTVKLNQSTRVLQEKLTNARGKFRLPRSSPLN